MIEGYKVVSLYDGCGMAYAALKRLGIPVSEYHSFEIDPYSIKIGLKNHPDMRCHGDANKLLENKNGEFDYLINNVDLLIGGSPCQDFSFAGKQLNFEGVRGQLTLTFIKIKEMLNPRFTILENVRMKAEIADIISDHVNLPVYMINSADFSEQNRLRLYWTNLPFDLKFQKNNQVLRHVLQDESEIPEKYFVKENLIVKYRGGNQLNGDYKSQANTIHDSDRKMGTISAGTHGYAIGYIQQSYKVGETANIRGFRTIKEVHCGNAKSPTLTTMQGGHRQPKVLCGSIVNRKLNPETGRRDDYNKDLPYTPVLEVRYEEKTGTLTTVQKDNVVKYYLRWRKLTPVECERLQTLPDNYTEGVSDTQRYKMIGNGFTINVICHLLKPLLKEHQQSIMDAEAWIEDQKEEMSMHIR